MYKYPDLEEKIKRTGSEIFASIQGEVPSVFDKKRWIGELIEWAMKDSDFKVKLLRFIDVLPSLRTDTLVVRLLKEYFADEKIAPMIMKWGIKGISERGILPKIAGSVIRSNIESLARQFIAGKDPEDALNVLRELRKDGYAFTLDLLGEVVVSEKEARGYTERYLKLLEFLDTEIKDWPENPVLDRDYNGPIPRLSISLKVSSFYSQLDPVDWNGSIEKTKEGLRPVFEKARDLGASVTLDMEHDYIKDLTIAIFKSILEEFKDYPHAGIAIQAYLKDAKADLLDLITWTEKNGTPITVRLVKGAYWDYEIAVNKENGWPIPVFLNKTETDRSYEELTKILLNHTGIIRPAFATHNIRSICNAIAAADSHGLPNDAIEFQTLYGMAEPIRKALQKMNFRVRVYTTAGELIPGMAYLVRRLLENISNESFLRKSFVENKTLDELIESPQPETETLNEDCVNSSFTNEAAADFSKAQNRERMTISLDRVKRMFGEKYPLIIGKEEVWTDTAIISRNPARPDEIIGTVSSATGEDAERAIEEAGRAWNVWKKTPPEDRAGYLFSAADHMKKKRFEIAALMVHEVGKTWKEADADVAEAVDFLEYYGHEIIRIGKPLRLGTYPGELNDYYYDPKGIGVVISPWNFPVAIPTGMIAAGIVTGNCVIFKPSGLSPVTGWKIMESFRLSGLPSGILQFLPGSGEEVGEYLVSHPETDFITFTGSKKTGLRIVKLAAEVRKGQRNIKKVIAEMGGKNAIIVDETADLDESVKGVLASSLGYQGQKCSACSRVIVIGDLYNRFCERLKEAMESVQIGPPEDPASYMGPVIDKGALEKIRKYIDIGREEEKTLLCRDVSGDGYYVGPAIFTDVAPGSSIAQDEIFGPVLSIMQAHDIEDAIAIANNTLYALTGGLFSRSPFNIRKARDELKVGNLYINRKITGALVGRQPFGGLGMSGVGSKAGGPDYLLQFMNPKSVSENTMRKGFTPEHQQA